MAHSVPLNTARFFRAASRDGPQSAAISGLKPPLRLLREGTARVRLMTDRQGRGPLAAFLPAGPAEGAALLRIYNVAHHLLGEGWRTTIVPWRLTLAARRRYLAAAAPDVVVMQGARHGLNLPHLYPEWPIVYDIDDADFHLEHLAGPVRRAMAEVTGVIAGSRYIAEWCAAAGAPAVKVIWTGTPIADRSWPVQVSRPPVVAWAQTRPMSYAREADLVARVMAEVAARRPGVTLRLYDKRPDDDSRFAMVFRAPGLDVEWRAACAYEPYLRSFDDVAVGLAPLCPQTPFSRGKSFGKVLAYLDAGVPVVGSSACEHPAFFTPRTGVISNVEADWVSAICRWLEAPMARAAVAEAAASDFRTRLSTQEAARRVAGVLTDVLRRTG